MRAHLNLLRLLMHLEFYFDSFHVIYTFYICFSKGYIPTTLVVFVLVLYFSFIYFYFWYVYSVFLVSLSLLNSLSYIQEDVSPFYVLDLRKF